MTGGLFLFISFLSNYEVKLRLPDYFKEVD